MLLTNYIYDELEIGQSATLEHVITEYDIQSFAAISHDVNPAHLDKEYAAGTIFKDVIAHGMLSGAYISAVLGTKLPGPGTIYLNQELSFLKPVYIGSTISVTLTVIEKLPKNRVILECKCVNQKDELVCSGVAKVLAPVKKIEVEVKSLPSIAVSFK